MASDDNCECPLCMEPFEVDDMSFYPCTCGYQICRFCWHRLKIDGNGLCPACRKAYSENPAHFEPLSEDEIVRIKKERRHKEVQKKQKLTENRRHLSDVRVVQKNLVFVVGLSHRLADAEILKKHEYFGKFGKITKVVINSSPSYAGAQTPSASAYVTYSKADEALKAIQTVNNVQIDNRVLKASLGTTKYCSHFLKGIQCPKSDCMYLHDLGEDNASFTKEQMSAGKHLEYESKLIENVLHIPRNLQNISNDQANQIIINQIHNGLPSALLTHSSNQQQQQSSTSSTNSTSTSSNTTNSNSNHTDKNDTKSRLKKPTSSTSRHQHQSSKTSDTSSKYANSSRQQQSSSSNKTNTKNNNNNNNSNNNRSTNNNASLKSSSDLKNTTEEEDYDDELVSDEVISDEEVVVKQNGTANEKHTTEQQATAPRINTTAKSYLSALNTDEASSNARTPTTHTHVVQSINYKDMLEKNIPVVDTNEDQAESKKSNNVSPVPATVAKTTETVTPLPAAETVKQKPAVEEEDTSNVNDHGHQGIVSDITHSLSTHHIVQEEDLGFDPWDEATKSLQDLMKIESSSHLAPVKPPFEKSASCEATPSAAQSLPHKSSTNPFPNQSFNTDADTTRQYFQQQQQQQPSMFNNTKVNDLQSFYRLQANGVITPEFNQLYQSHLQQQQQQPNLASSDCNTSILQKLNEIMLNNAKSSSLGVGPNSHPFLNGASTNPASGSDSFATTFSHENYLNKLLLQKQSLSSKQSQHIAAPPGFNSSSINNNKNNGASFNSPISTSSTSSSSSSTSSSVNNSTSTTPALNGNGSNNNGKAHSTDDFLNDQQEKSATPHTNNQPQMNQTQFSNNLQDTFRSIFPNANISFGATKQQQQQQLQQQHLNTNLTNNYSAKGSQSNQQYADKQNCWPDDPAIVSLNNGFLSNGQLKASNNNDTNDLQERMKLEFDGLYSNPNKQLEQLSYLTSSLQQQQQQHQPNNINNLASLLKKQQNEQQFNNSFLSQFQMLYQQHQLAQFQQQQLQQQQNNVNSNSFMTHSSNNIHSNNLHSHNSNNNSMNMNNKSNMNIQDQMNNANKSIEDLHNYQQKLLLLNNSHFNGLNGISNTMLNNFLNNDLNQFANANMNNYGYLIDSNQNIAGSMKSQQNQMNNASASAAINNNNTNNGMNGLPPLLNMQQQSYMQQLLLQNYGQNPTTAAANLNSD